MVARKAERGMSMFGLEDKRLCEIEKLEKKNAQLIADLQAMYGVVELKQEMVNTLIANSTHDRTVGADGWIAELRSDVATFAIAMEKTLQKHDNRPGWENEPFDYLLDRLVDEYQELADVFKGKYTKSAAMAQDVCSELVDIANFCMMIYCNCQRGVEEWPLPAEPKKGENDG